jgi:transposase
MSKPSKLLAKKEIEIAQQNTLILDLQKEISGYKNKIELSKENEQTAKENEQTAKEKISEIQNKYDRLYQSFLDAQRHQYGTRSERFIDEGQLHLPLFDTNEPPAVTTDNDDDKNIETITYTRNKKGKKKPPTIPTREEIIPVDESERTCTCCGREKQCIGYETKQLLNYQPAIFEIINQKREKLACKKGCGSQLITAPVPKHILPKCSATESLLSFIVVSKVLDRQPLYHLEKRIEEIHGWHIHRKTMARWMIQLADKLQPLINLMKDEVLGHDIASVDATTLQVLIEKDRKATVKSQVYCIRGGPPDKGVTLYEYNAYLQRSYINETFDEYQGYIQSDAAPVYADLINRENIKMVFCHAHARRYFDRIYKANRKKATESKQALVFYRKLYEIERHIKENEYSETQCYDYRQTDAKPLLADHKKWLDALSLRASPKGPLGKAVRYSIKHWEQLTAYLEDGRLEIDNNATERDIKPFVMARKNFLFSATPDGADSLGVHFGLVITARHHGHDPLKYYDFILKQIPHCKSFDDYERLLPWNVPIQ